jgi:hypothetical protein
VDSGQPTNNPFNNALYHPSPGGPGAGRRDGPGRAETAAGRPPPATERFTVDLSSDLNDDLAARATPRQRSVGRRVPKTEVVRVLIEPLLADPSLAAQGEEQLRET